MLCFFFSTRPIRAQQPAAFHFRGAIPTRSRPLDLRVQLLNLHVFFHHQACLKGLLLLTHLAQSAWCNQHRRPEWGSIGCEDKQELSTLDCGWEESCLLQPIDKNVKVDFWPCEIKANDFMCSLRVLVKHFPDWWLYIRCPGARCAPEKVLNLVNQLL